MKTTLSKLLIVAMIATSFAPTIAKADSGGSAPTETVTFEDPAAEADYKALQDLKFNGWFGTRLFSQIGGQVTNRKLKLGFACGHTLLKAWGRQAVHTVLSAAPLTSRGDHYVMEHVDPEMMEIAKGKWDQGGEDERSYDIAQWQGGAVSLVRGMIERKTPTRRASVATITGNAAFMREVSKKPKCLQAYLALLRAQVVLAEKIAAREREKADANKSDKAQADGNLARGKKYDDKAEVMVKKANSLARLPASSSEAR